MIVLVLLTISLIYWGPIYPLQFLKEFQAKMQNLFSKFLQNSFQFFNIVFIYSSSLGFRFIQLKLLRSYFYVIGISYDKAHFTCIQVNLSQFKMIITSGYIEDTKNIQEKVNFRSDTSSIPVNLSRFNKARYLARYLLIYQATGFLIQPATFYFNWLFCLWVCVNLIGVGEQTLLEQESSFKKPIKLLFK